MIKTTSYKKTHSAISIAVIVIALLLIAGCSFSRHAIAALRSTGHFIPSQDDPRVLFESEAEDYAKKVVSFLPSAIQQVEEKQYRPFAEPVRVYICASRESFKKYSGTDGRGIVLAKLFLSPRVFEKGDKIAKMYLMHELSHLHLLQRLGTYKMSRLPFWFKEGLATYISGGGGAFTVPEEEAINSIKTGKHFVPNETGGFLFQETAKDFGISHHMFYRQSMLFISYLAAINESEFRKLLLSIENGERFSTALREAYNKKLEELWNGFLHEINNMG